MRVYTSTRPRGLASWRPQARTMALVDEVKSVLEELDLDVLATTRTIEADERRHLTTTVSRLVDPR